MNIKPQKQFNMLATGRFKFEPEFILIEIVNFSAHYFEKP
jgi:hypothetical protein